MATGFNLARPEDGHRWSRLAAALVDRTQAGPLRQASLHDAIGVVFFAEKNFARAEQEHTLALKLLDILRKSDLQKLAKGAPRENVRKAALKLYEKRNRLR